MFPLFLVFLLICPISSLESSEEDEKEALLEFLSWTDSESTRQSRMIRWPLDTVDMMLGGEKEDDGEVDTETNDGFVVSLLDILINS